MKKTRENNKKGVKRKKEKGARSRRETRRK